MRRLALRIGLGSSDLPRLHLVMLGVVTMAFLCLGSVSPSLAQSAEGDTQKPTATTETQEPEKEKKKEPEKEAKKSLELVGGDETRTVSFVACSSFRNGPELPPNACSEAPAGRKRFLGGQVTIVVQNETEAEAGLDLAYFPQGSGEAIDLPGDANWVYLGGAEDDAKGVSPLGKGESRPLTIGFALPVGNPPNAVGGNLVLQLRGEKGESRVVPLSGAMREFSDVTVRPATLKMESGDGSADLTLAGAGVVDFLRYGGFGRTRRAVLRDESGNATEAIVELPTAGDVEGGIDPNLAQTTLTLSEDRPPAGKYSGQLALSNISAKAPSVGVELSSGQCFALLVLMAFLGVAGVALPSRLSAFAVRRRLLLKVLKQSEAAYEHVDKPDIEATSWDLGDLLGRTGKRGLKRDEFRLQGIEGLRASIETARSGKDLDEDTERVLDMVARIQRWLRVEPAARRLKLVDARVPVGKVGEETWFETNAWRDTQILLEIARREPKDVDAADDLVWRLLRQITWHHGFAAVWEATAGDERLKDVVTELETALGEDKSTIGSRTPEDQDRLDQQLLGAVELFRSYGGSVGELPELDEPETKAGVTAADWTASPNFFTGWATLDGKSYGQLTRRAARGAKRLGREDLKLEYEAAGVSDYLWSGVALALACFVYGVSEYDSTWGTKEDLATAFLAGALGTIAINWAALPIFQSIRTRTGKAEETGLLAALAVKAGKEKAAEEKDAGKKPPAKAKAAGGS